MARLVDSNAFEPEWSVPPGATIAAMLSARSLSRENFAQRLGVSVEVVQRLLLGLEEVTDNIAVNLSSCLGSSSAFWLAREAQYRADSERIRRQNAAASREIWVKQFPAREMAALGWINDFRSTAEAANECLKLFGVPDVATWQVQYAGAISVANFRMSASSRMNPGAVVAWLRWAELIAGRTPCSQWQPDKFRKALKFARRLTWQKDPAKFLPILRQLCAEAGVAVVIARTPKGCPSSGATRFLSPSKAMMVLSFRYRSDDQFWFTFFHEAAHLLLHGPTALFLEDEGEMMSDEEREANEFAEATLVPPEYASEFSALLPEKHSILGFARRVGVAPGVIVGQLQHQQRILPNQLNWLKRRYDWSSLEPDRLIP